MINELVQALFIICDEIFHAMEVEDVTMEGYLTRVHTIKEQKSLPYLTSMSVLHIFLFTVAFISLNPTG
jgi:hypothetical protein